MDFLIVTKISPLSCFYLVVIFLNRDVGIVKKVVLGFMSEKTVNITYALCGQISGVIPS